MSSGESITVLFVVPSFEESSGWFTACHGIIRSLSSVETIEAVLAVGKEDERVARAHFSDLEILVLPSVHRADFRRPRHWIAAVKSAARARQVRTLGRRIDLVHSLEGYPAGWIGHLFARAHDVPHVITAVGTYSVRWARSNPLDSGLYRRTLAGASCVTAISNATLERLKDGQRETLPGGSYQVNLLGISSHESDPLSSAVGERETPVLLTVGAIKRRKGQDVSLRAFFRVRERYPRAQYRMIGKVTDPDFFSELRRLMLEHGASGVEFLGLVSDQELLRHYREASIFILTSRDVGDKFEGFGLVCLEAGRFGVPVVASDAGGLAEAVRDGSTGLVVESENVIGVADAIERLLDDPELAKSLGKGNRSWARKLSWSRFACEQVEIYRRCLGSRGA